MATDGSQLTRIVEDASAIDRPLAWLADGSRLAILSQPDDNPYVVEISLVDPDGDNRTSLGMLQPYSPPTWSPDGSMIAFGSDGVAPWLWRCCRTEGAGPTDNATST